MRIAVIGSGFGGLAAALRLSAAGHKVDVFEKNDAVGGRARAFSLGGHHFDAGPTVLTAPFMFDELFELVGERREDHVQLTPLDPFYRIFSGDGRHLDYRRDLEATLSEVARWSPDDVDGARRLAGRVSGIFERFYPYTERSMMHPGVMLSMLPYLIRHRALANVAPMAARYVDDPFLRRVFSFHPLLVGGDPRRTPALYTLIVEFERRWGVHYAMGGTARVVRALASLAEGAGARIHLDAEVTQITVDGGRAAGVRLADGNVHRADAVVSDADVGHTYSQLLPEGHRPSRARLNRLRYSMSLFVLYFGTRRRYPDSPLLHHNVLLDDDHERTLADVFGGRALPEGMFLYVHMPSRTDPGVAPDGGETFYVLSAVPNLTADVDWSQTTNAYKERIYDVLEHRFLPGLRENLTVEHVADPLHFRDDLNSPHGAAFSLLPSLFQSGWFRPHNRSSTLPGVYLVGAGTHPGAGVPAVLASAKIAARLIGPA